MLLFDHARSWRRGLKLRRRLDGGADIGGGAPGGPGLSVSRASQRASPRLFIVRVQGGSGRIGRLHPGPASPSFRKANESAAAMMAAKFLKADTCPRTVVTRMLAWSHGADPEVPNSDDNPLYCESPILLSFLLKQCSQICDTILLHRGSP